MTDKGTSGQSVQKSPEPPEGLFLMDGIEGLRSLPRHSVDMLLTRSALRHTRNFWDVPLPLPELWEAVKWAVKPGRRDPCFSRSAPMTRCWGPPTCPCSAMSGCGTKAALLAFLNARRAPAEKTENILVFYQKLPLYNPQFEQGKPYKRSLTNNGDSPNYGKFVRTTGGWRTACAFRGMCSRSPPSAYRPPHAEAGGPVRVFHQDLYAARRAGGGRLRGLRHNGGGRSQYGPPLHLF